MKTFKLDGLNIWITNVESEYDACFIAHLCRWGVTPDDLIEVEKVDDGIPIYGIYDRPEFDPTKSICINPFKSTQL